MSAAKVIEAANLVVKHSNSHPCTLTDHEHVAYYSVSTAAMQLLIRRIDEMKEA